MKRQQRTQTEGGDGWREKRETREGRRERERRTDGEKGGTSTERLTFRSLKTF